MPEIPVPAEIRDAVIRELYRLAAELDWENISGRQKTKYYSQWVEDPKIGGLLADYDTAEGMRVWIKDGPMKEYARAREEFGPYAKYTTERLSPPEEFIPGVLGDTWRVRPGSRGEKPMHCVATDGTQERYVCWGKVTTFRDLLFAAVREAVRSDLRPLIVVYELEGQEVDQRQREVHAELAEHCRLDLAHVLRRSEPKTSSGPPTAR